MNKQSGMTLLEVLVASVIIAILASTFTVVVSGQIKRAKIAAAVYDIKTLELAIEAYKTDLGAYPPSGSGISPTSWQPEPPDSAEGSGYLFTCLRFGMKDSAGNLDPRWQGPYIDVKVEKLVMTDGIIPIPADAIFPEISYSDPWELPIIYIRSDPDNLISDGYEEMNGTYSDFFQEYFKPTEFQLISFGPNRTTITNQPNKRGTDIDDITNW